MSGEARSPRVTVVTAAYNGEQFLERTLRSLQAQSFRDFEALVIDDGSTDGSAAIVESFARRDPRIRLLRQQNEGIAKALNHGVREARGELIAFLDHDDLWHPDKLVRQVREFDRSDAVGLVGCYSTLIDEDGRNLGWRFGTSAKGDVYREMLSCDLVGGGSVALLRRAAVDEVGFFDSDPRISGRSDWDMWLRIVRSWEYVGIEEVLVGYTRCPTNYSRDYEKMLAAGEAVLAKAAAIDPEIDSATLERALARDAFGILCLCLADGAFAEGRACLRRSLSFSWAPVLSSPRRWGGVFALAAATLLPRALFDRLWGAVARWAFGFRFRERFPGVPRSARDRD